MQLTKKGARGKAEVQKELKCLDRLILLPVAGVLY
jgi:hypothetical protein